MISTSWPLMAATSSDAAAKPSPFFPRRWSRRLPPVRIGCSIFFLRSAPTFTSWAENVHETLRRLCEKRYPRDLRQAARLRSVSPLFEVSPRMAHGKRQRRGEFALVDRVAH